MRENLSFMQYIGIVFQTNGKKSTLIIFLMHPHIIIYMIDKGKPMKFPTGQIHIFSSSEAPDIYS